MKLTLRLVLTEFSVCLTFATQFKKKRYGNSYQREYRTAE